MRVLASVAVRHRELGVLHHVHTRRVARQTHLPGAASNAAVTGRGTPRASNALIQVAWSTALLRTPFPRAMPFWLQGRGIHL